MTRLIPQYPAPELARMRELFFPEERRHEFTSKPWDGASFRHFRNPKIVCLEHYRRAGADLPQFPGTPIRICFL